MFLQPENPRIVHYTRVSECGAEKATKNIRTQLFKFEKRALTNAENAASSFQKKDRHSWGCGFEQDIRSYIFCQNFIKN